MYSTKLTAALTGATQSQLNYWRRETGNGPLLVPEYGVEPRAMYSFRDVVALRVCVRLRSETSLQRVRRAVATLQEVAPDTHLSTHSLRTAGRTIVWLTEQGDFVDLVDHPGQPGIRIVMEEVFASFTTASGRTVPSLMTPAQGLSIDDTVRNGYPVLEGTRIPYDAIASLAQDGLEPDEILTLYPKATPEGVRGAVELAELVAQDQHDAA